jgi:hypothetical protein
MGMTKADQITKAAYKLRNANSADLNLIDAIAKERNDTVTMAAVEVVRKAKAKANGLNG